MDLDSEEVSYVLYLRGVYLKDLLNTNFDNIDDTPEDSPYDVIPARFNTLDTWILQTNILCSHCGLSHNNVPIFLPEYINNNGITIKRVLFCTFPCAMSYIRNHYYGPSFDNLLIGIRHVYTIFTSETIDEIPYAPETHEIDAFGGKNAKYKIYEFRKLVDELVSLDKYLIR